MFYLICNQVKYIVSLINLYSIFFQIIINLKIGGAESKHALGHKFTIINTFTIISMKKYIYL